MKIYFFYLGLFFTLFFSMKNVAEGSNETHLITFFVDTKTLNSDQRKNALDIGLRGNVRPLSWAKNLKMTDPDGDGIYAATVKFYQPSKIAVYFKFTLNQLEFETGDARMIHLGSTDTFSSTFRYKKPNENPFRRFVGRWTLKDDNWEQNSNGNTLETIKIPGHQTICKNINTDNSILCTVDATSARGHILWTFDREQNQVQHLSNFFPSRNGVGKGSIDKDGNISLKIVFEGEGEYTFRLYQYQWLSDVEYSLTSVQYKNNKPTGEYYGGVFTKRDSLVE